MPFGIDDALMISGGLSLLGGIFGSAGQAQANRQNIALSREQMRWQEIQNQKAMDFSGAQAARQMEFQNTQSSTAYQRAVQDLELAGLNPMLAYSQGGAQSGAGASGAGVTSSGSVPRVENVAGPVLSSAGSALSAMSAVQQIAQSKAQIEQISAQTERIRSETLPNNLHSAKLLADIGNVNSVEALNKITRLLREEEIPGVRASSASALEKMWAETESPLAATDTAFAADVRRRKALATLAEQEIPKGEAEAKFYQDLGRDAPYLKFILMTLRALSSARGLARD